MAVKSKLLNTVTNRCFKNLATTHRIITEIFPIHSLRRQRQVRVSISHHKRLSMKADSHPSTPIMNWTQRRHRLVFPGRYHWSMTHRGGEFKRLVGGPAGNPIPSVALFPPASGACCWKIQGNDGFACHLSITMNARSRASEVSMYTYTLCY